MTLAPSAPQRASPLPHRVVTSTATVDPLSAHPDLHTDLHRRKFALRVTEIERSGQCPPRTNLGAAAAEYPPLQVCVEISGCAC